VQEIVLVHCQQIGLLESHIMREISPRRLRSCKKRSPSRVAHRSPSTSSDESYTATPTKSDTTNSTLARSRKRLTPRRRRNAFRRVSVSTTSSDTSHTLTTPRKLPTRRCVSLSKVKPIQNERQTRQSVKRLLHEDDSGTDDDAKPAKRVLRSSSYRH